MHRYVEQLFLGVIAGVISYYLAPTLPNIPSPTAWLQYANNPGVRFIISLAVVWYILSLLIGWVRKRRKQKQLGGVAVGSVGPRQMRHPRDEGVIRHFGVDWEYTYGRPNLSDDMTAFAKGPYCPDCGSELMDDEKKRLLRWDKPIWKCPGCTFRTSRPSEFLYEESDAVERVIVREYEVEENRLDDLAPAKETEDE